MLWVQNVAAEVDLNFLLIISVHLCPLYFRLECLALSFVFGVKESKTRLSYAMEAHDKDVWLY